MHSAVALIIFSVALPSSLGCTTAKSVIEIPPCADRVEIQGQAQRLSPTRFELDHTLDFVLARTQLTLRAGDRVHELFIESTRPDPLRLFFGVGASAVGGLLLLSAADGLLQRQGAADERVLYRTLGGAALVAVGTAMAMTGWHPAQSTITLPDACPGQPLDAPAAGIR